MTSKFDQTTQDLISARLYNKSTSYYTYKITRKCDGVVLAYSIDEKAANKLFCYFNTPLCPCRKEKITPIHSAALRNKLLKEAGRGDLISQGFGGKTQFKIGSFPKRKKK